MRRISLYLLLAVLFAASCKKDDVIQAPSAQKVSTFNPYAQSRSSTAGQALQGVNWACTADNFSDTILVLSGLTSTDSYATVSAKTNSVLTSLQTNTSANTIRIPCNYSTTSQAWWNSYTGVIDEATSKGFNVIIGYWEAASSEDGLIDNTTQFWAMWQTVVNKYATNPHVYFEIMNEPHGYTLSAWTTICAQWLSNYPTVPQGHILIDGTAYAQDVTGVGADSRFTSCLLSIHDYTFFTSSSLTTAYEWESRLAGNVGSYGSRTVLTEFGITMNDGTNYTGAIGGNENIAYMQGFTNEVRNLGMGSVYWPGIRTGDSYAMETLGGSGTSLTLTNNNTSGLSRLQYGWSIGNGGTNTFYSGAYYRLLNLNSGQALDVNSASVTEGASIIQWTQNGGTNQQWTIAVGTSGYYTLTNSNSGMLFDVNGASTTEGAGIIQWPSDGGSNQQWQLTSTATGVFKLINKNSGMALDVSGASVTAGASVIQWPYNGGTNQQWTVVQE